MTVSDSTFTPLPAEAWRRQELGAFLRSRRERLDPVLHRIAPGARRRARGLRREEVAALLGVSPSWYTKLEQGLDVSPSPRLLARIAEVMLLTGIEREQLLRLGMDEPAGDVPVDEAALPSARMIIDAMPYSPAFVLTARADYVAGNRAALALFGDRAGRGNQLLSLFLEENTRRFLLDWLESARSQVAMFRTTFVRHVHDPALQNLVLSLLKDSPEFRQLWSEYELPSHSSRRVRCRRTAEGPDMAFNHFTFFADLEKQLRVEVFHPADAETEAQMAALVRG